MKWLVLLALCIWAVCPRMARANGGDFADQGAAFAACRADSTALARKTDSQGRPYVVTVDCTWSQTNRFYSCEGRSPTGNPTACALQLGQSSPWSSQYRYPAGGTCASRVPMKNARYSGNAGTCSGGCKYVVNISKPWTTQSAGGLMITNASELGPTGDACTVGTDDANPPAPLGNEDQCVQSGTLTQCFRSDGKSCATASTGKQFCWSPGENGIKKADSGNQAATKSPENAQINAPADKPANGGDWTVTGQGTVTETNSSGTTKSNVTAFDSTYGKDGTGKDDGTGTGTGGGSGSGSGDGDGEGDDDGAGGVGEGVGDLYGGTDLTIGGLLTDYYGKITATPMLASIKSFMMVNGGGSCPVFTMPATAWTPVLTFDAHCSGSVYAVLLSMGWVVFGVVSYYAIRISVT